MLVVQDTTSWRSLWGKEDERFLGIVLPWTFWQGQAATEALGRLDHAGWAVGIVGPWGSSADVGRSV